MARLYSDEDFPLPVVERLRQLGHDVLTVQQAGLSNQKVDDVQVLANASADFRAVLTHNHADFKRLHRQGVAHHGIVSCTQDPTDHAGLAGRIHNAIAAAPSLSNQFVRITRPNTPAPP